jgi:hypothetical protein
MTFWKWSRTAANNATADGSINWAEGQVPSTVNDSARAMMAAASKYRDDVGGAIATAGQLFVFDSRRLRSTLFCAGQRGECSFSAKASHLVMALTSAEPLACYGVNCSLAKGDSHDL